MCKQITPLFFDFTTSERFGNYQKFITNMSSTKSDRPPIPNDLILKFCSMWMSLPE